MKRTLTESFKRATGKALTQAPKLTKPSIVAIIRSLAYATDKTDRQLLRLTKAALLAMLEQAHEACALRAEDAILSTMDVVADDNAWYCEQTPFVPMVDTSCVASVFATSPLPIAQHAEPLPVARIAPPIVKQGFWSIVGQRALSAVAGIAVVASAPLIVGGMLACVLVAHVADQI